MMRSSLSSQEQGRVPASFVRMTAICCTFTSPVDWALWCGRLCFLRVIRWTPRHQCFICVSPPSYSLSALNPLPPGCCLCFPCWHSWIKNLVLPELPLVGLLHPPLPRLIWGCLLWLLHTTWLYHSVYTVCTDGLAECSTGSHVTLCRTLFRPSDTSWRPYDGLPPNLKSSRSYSGPLLG